jgi:hypothetical protein
MAATMEGPHADLFLRVAYNSLKSSVRIFYKEKFSYFLGATKGSQRTIHDAIHTSLTLVHLNVSFMKERFATALTLQFEMRLQMFLGGDCFRNRWITFLNFTLKFLNHPRHESPHSGQTI